MCPALLEADEEVSLDPDAFKNVEELKNRNDPKSNEQIHGAVQSEFEAALAASAVLCVSIFAN